MNAHAEVTSTGRDGKLEDKCSSNWFPDALQKLIEG
jgi:hypothetical protein